MAPEFSDVLLVIVKEDVCFRWREWSLLCGRVRNWDKDEPGSHVAVGHSGRKVHVYPRYFGGKNCGPRSASEVNQLLVLDFVSCWEERWYLPSRETS